MKHPKEQPPLQHTLTVTFFPMFSKNPYQYLLENGLRAHKIRVVARFGQSLISMLSGWLCGRPHVLHLHWLHALYERGGNRPSRLRFMIAVLTLRTVQRFGVRIVWTAHNLGHHERVGSYIDRKTTAFIAARADAIILHSQSARDRIVSEFPAAGQSKLHVIPMGNYIDAYPNNKNGQQSRKQLGIDPNHTVFLFFGLVRPYKGVLELIAAFREASIPESTLVIAGNPVSETETNLVEDHIKDAHDIMFIPKFIPDDEIQLFMNACDVVALPYKDVLTSAAAILALSFGKACIAPSFGYFVELLDQEGTIFYESSKHDALTQALRTASMDRERLATMGLHNEQLAKELDWSRIGEQTAKVYREVCGAPRSP